MLVLVFALSTFFYSFDVAQAADGGAASTQKDVVLAGWEFNTDTGMPESTFYVFYERIPTYQYAQQAEGAITYRAPDAARQDVYNIYHPYYNNTSLYTGWLLVVKPPPEPGYWTVVIESVTGLRMERTVYFAY